MAFRVNGYAIDHIEYNGAIITARPQRLASCDIDIDNGTVDYTLEGDSNTYGLTFSISGDSITYTWPDGFTCTINIYGNVDSGEES